MLYDGKLDAAEELFRDALSARRETLGDDHPLVAETLNNLGYLLYFKHDHRQAADIFREALGRYQHSYGNEHPEVSSLMNNLGRMLLEDDQIAEAEPLLADALAIDRKLKDPGHNDLAFSLNSLAMTLTARQQYEEAEPLYLEALAIARHHGHRLEGSVLTNLAALYCRTGDYERAAQMIAEARPAVQRDYADEPWQAAHVDSVDGARLTGLGRFAEAEPLFLESHAVFEERWGPGALFTRSRASASTSFMRAGKSRTGRGNSATGRLSSSRSKLSAGRDEIRRGCRARSRRNRRAMRPTSFCRSWQSATAAECPCRGRRRASWPDHVERVGHAVDVVEPGGDQGDLQDAAVVESGRAQPLVVPGRDLGGVPRDLRGEIEHGAIPLVDRGRFVILPDGVRKRLVQGDPAQELLVRGAAVRAAVGRRHHGGDHFVLPAAQRQVRRHQRAEGREGMVQRLRYQ
ncbi:MAG TPA: tetratricopeptide repeat-containing protein [Gammaproteobacteria bacterium]|nr:tetratricopeptide repeat-containing protein [Gammaproteobacteria bacterium]